MVITCEGCERRFQVDAARIPPRGARVRCKRCQHRFHVNPDGSVGAPSDGDETADGQTLGGLTQPGTADELRFVNEAPAEDASAEAAPPEPEADDEDPELPPPDEAIAEGPWEFGDSNLALDAAVEANRNSKRSSKASRSTAPEAEAPEGAASASEPEPGDPAEPESAQAALDALPDEPEEPPAAEEPAPAVAMPAPDESELPDDTTLRPIAPVAGAESAMFEMTDDGGDGDPLELDEPEAAHPPGMTSPAALEAEPAAPADDAAPQEAPAPSEPPVADIDGEGLDAYGEATFDGFDLDDDDDDDDAGDGERPDPDWPDVGTTPPEAPVSVSPRARSGLWQNVGWIAPAVALLAVLHGSVQVEPAAPPAPAGSASWEGMRAENVRGRFIDNARSGTLFVVSGELVPGGGEAAAAAGRLRVVLLDEAGQVISRPAIAGPSLSEADLRELPVGALTRRQEQAAAETAAAPLPPGERRGFDAVLERNPGTGAPARFRIERVGS